jgi:hypothetical protein
MFFALPGVIAVEFFPGVPIVVPSPLFSVSGNRRCPTDLFFGVVASTFPFTVEASLLRFSDVNGLLTLSGIGVSTFRGGVMLVVFALTPSWAFF